MHNSHEMPENICHNYRSPYQYTGRNKSKLVRLNDLWVMSDLSENKFGKHPIVSKRIKLEKVEIWNNVIPTILWF